MNTPNFPLMELNARERRQSLLRQAEQEQWWAGANQPSGPRLSFRGSGLWVRGMLLALNRAMPKRLPRDVPPKFAEDAG